MTPNKINSLYTIAMKKQLYLLLSFALLNLGASAQGIFGTWQFDDVIAGPEATEEGITMAKAMLAKYKITFNTNNTYTASAGKRSEDGKYTYDPSSFEITMTDPRGTTDKGSAEIMPDKRLYLKMDKLQMVMKKSEEAVAAAPAKPAKQMSANSEGLSSHADIAGTTQNAKYVAVVPEGNHLNKPYLHKKWYFESRESDREAADLQLRMTTLLRGSFFNFSDNNYSATMMSIPENGSWKLDQNSGTLTLNTTDGEKQWRIQKLTADELVLTRLNTHEVWTFKSKL